VREARNPLNRQQLPMGSGTHMPLRLEYGCLDIFRKGSAFCFDNQSNLLPTPSSQKPLLLNQVSSGQNSERYFAPCSYGEISFDLAQYGSQPMLRVGLGRGGGGGEHEHGSQSQSQSYSGSQKQWMSKDIEKSTVLRP
jgi:hypothetical protein